MSGDTYTEVTRQSWGSRLGGAFKGIVVGFILVAVAFMLLFWNEGRAVRRQKSLTEGGGVVVSIGADRVDPAYEGKLVHMTGMATTDEVLSDPDLGISANAIRLERKTEMYQWRETSQSQTEKKLGGGTETKTTYSYERVWSDRPIASGGFKVVGGHENPASMPYGAYEATASNVRLGAYRLSPGLVAKMSRFEPLSVASLSDLPYDLRWRAKLHDGGIYVGRDPASPQIGDVRISYRVVRPATVSIVSQQAGESFTPYRAAAGSNIELLSHGVVTAESMFKAAQQGNRVTTWIVRVVGFFLMFFGLRTIARPLSVLADVVPAIGNFVEAGTSTASFFLAAFLASATIAVAWLRYRPMIGLAVLLVAIAAIVALVILIRKAMHRRAGAAAVPPPPPPQPAAT